MKKQLRALVFGSAGGGDVGRRQRRLWRKPADHGLLPGQ